MFQRLIKKISRNIGLTSLLLSTVLLSIAFLSACTGIPKGVEPVKDFELNRYLGKWYEIARLDHRFERGLSNISAEYSLNDDGDLRVINRGYNDKKKQWQNAEGKAKFTGPSNVGSLKVSFFGPFYGGYNIIELDKQNYQYVMIAGNDKSYLWILSRQPTLDSEIKQKLVDKAAQLNFPVDQLIFVNHDLSK